MDGLEMPKPAYLAAGSCLKLLDWTATINRVDSSIADVHVSVGMRVRDGCLTSKEDRADRPRVSSMILQLRLRRAIAVRPFRIDDSEVQHNLNLVPALQQSLGLINPGSRLHRNVLH